MDTNYKKIIDRDLGYDFIRFFAMTLIVIFHFVTTCYEFGYRIPPLIKNNVFHGNLGFGSVGVALFFMLSGAVLSMQKDYPIMEFYKKRLIRISIPQWIGFILAIGATFIINKTIFKTNVFGIFISFLGINYCGIPWSYFGINPIWVIGEWFTAVIILLYIIFPLLKYLFNKSQHITTIAIMIIFLLNLKYQILSGGNGSFSITNGLMCFWSGMLFNKYKNLIRNNIYIYIY